MAKMSQASGMKACFLIPERSISLAKILILFYFVGKSRQSFTEQPNIVIFALMKRAIIIGASSGIGREVAKLLLADGWYVGVAARRADLLAELKASAPSQVTAARIDVTADDAAGRLLDLVRELGGVSLFVYCAGVGKQNMQLDGSVELATAAVNVKGFTCLLDAMFNYMAANQGGDIAVITSIAGTKGLGAAPAYSATKAYQATYIQALEQLSNMRRLHIRFTDFRPGFVDTDMLAGGGRYPMLMDKTAVAREIVRAVKAHRHVHLIDWRYRLLVALWRLIPGRLWRKLNIRTKG